MLQFLKLCKVREFSIENKWLTNHFCKQTSSYSLISSFLSSVFWVSCSITRVSTSSLEVSDTTSVKRTPMIFFFIFYLLEKNKKHIRLLIHSWSVVFKWIHTPSGPVARGAKHCVQHASQNGRPIVWPILITKTTRACFLYMNMSSGMQYISCSSKWPNRFKISNWPHLMHPLPCFNRALLTCNLHE